MKREPGSASSGWFPILRVLIEMAALGLCTWAMSADRNRGRVLTGGSKASATPPPDVAPPAAT